MDKVGLYRQVFSSYKELCANGLQNCSFHCYCREHGVDQCQMPTVLKGEFQKITTLPGYRLFRTDGIHDLCRRIYNEYKELCAAGHQPGTFRSYCNRYGITKNQMDGFKRRNKVKVAGLPGYTGPAGSGNVKSQSIPFEEVIFEEAGFLPADTGNMITVKVDGHVAVSFPADTDVAVISRFVRRMGKEAGDVGA